VLRDVCDELVRFETWFLVPNTHCDFVIKNRVKDGKNELGVEAWFSIMCCLSDEYTSKSPRRNKWLNDVFFAERNPLSLGHHDSELIFLLNHTGIYDRN